jgi:RNA polymerase sigma factor for flagellar operon FliA
VTDRPVPLPLTPAQQQLVLDSRRFARRATKFHGWKHRAVLSPDDVGQLVELALVEAARHFDPEHGVSFTTFAWRRVDGVIADAAGLDREEVAVRRAFGACVDLQNGVVDFEETDDSVTVRAREIALRAATSALPEPPATPDAALEDADLRRAVDAGVAALPDRPRQVIDALYRRTQTLREVSAALGVSYATVRRDHDQALDALRDFCKRAGH